MRDLKIEQIFHEPWHKKFFELVELTSIFKNSTCLLKITKIENATDFYEHNKHFGDLRANF